MASHPATAARDAFMLALVMSVAIAALATLNMLPAVLGGEPRNVLRYDSVAQVESGYGVSLWQPRAMSAPWRWPPQRIRIGVGELDWVQYEFGDRAPAGLVASQTVQRTDRRPGLPPEELLPAGELLQEDEAVVGGRPARVCRRLLADGTIVHELWWRWNGRTVMLRLRGPLSELQAIAARAVGSAE